MRTRSRKHEIIRTVLLFILLIAIIVAGGFISKHRDQFDTHYGGGKSSGHVTGINVFSENELN